MLLARIDERNLLKLERLASFCQQDPVGQLGREGKSRVPLAEGGEEGAEEGRGARWRGNLSSKVSSCCGGDVALKGEPEGQSH